MIEFTDSVLIPKVRVVIATFYFSEIIEAEGEGTILEKASMLLEQNLRKQYELVKELEVLGLPPSTEWGEQTYAIKGYYLVAGEKNERPN